MSIEPVSDSVSDSPELFGWQFEASLQIQHPASRQALALPLYTRPHPDRAGFEARLSQALLFDGPTRQAARDDAEAFLRRHFLVKGA